MKMPDIMDLLVLKKELLVACFREIDERAGALRKVMDEAQQSANEYGQPKDRYDSYRSQLLRKRDMFGQQLQKILEQRKLLEKLEPVKRCEAAGFGALVDVGEQLVFISVGLGKIEHEGRPCFVISAAVPYYKAMEGKKAGDTFEFRGKEIRILEIA